MPIKALTKGILALHATAHLEPGKELPTRLLICPWGEIQTNKGRIICNSTTLSQLPRNNALAKRDRIALDFNHNTVEGSPSYRGEPAKVAAYANFEVVEGEGIYLSAIEWTPEGREHAEGGHYPDLSPAIATNDAGEIIFLHSAGLARQGEIDGIVLFSAPSHIQLIRTLSADPTTTNPMDYKKLLLTVLGLAESATDEEVTAAIQAKAEKKDGEDSTEDIKAMSARIKSLEEAVKTFSASGEKQERDQLVARAIREGKVIPLSAEQIASMPVTTLSALVDGLPVTVPLEARTPEKIKEFSAGMPDNSVAAEIRENLGISKEAWDKHNAA